MCAYKCIYGYGYRYGYVHSLLLKLFPDIFMCNICLIGELKSQI